MCIHRSCCYMRTIFSIIIGCPLQIIVIQLQERCIQNVYTPFPLLRENHIFNNYRLSNPNHSHKVTGTVYTECVYTFPLLHKNHIFNDYRLSTPKSKSYSYRNGVYRMCVHRSRCYMRIIFSIIIGCPLQIIVIQLQERCMQNVFTPFPFLHENNIFNNYRFSTPNHSHTVTGTLYTEGVYTVPVATWEPYFQ